MSNYPSVREIIERHETDPSANISPYDWRTKVWKFFKAGDAEGMRTAAIPTIQYSLLELAHEAPDDRVKFSAAQFVMGQAGQGVQNSITINHRYDQLPEDQLLIMLKSKMEMIAKLNPNFSLEKLLLPDVSALEGELVEVEGK